MAVGYVCYMFAVLSVLVKQAPRKPEDRQAMLENVEMQPPAAVLQDPSLAKDPVGKSSEHTYLRL